MSAMPQTSISSKFFANLEKLYFKSFFLDVKIEDLFSKKKTLLCLLKAFIGFIELCKILFETEYIWINGIFG